MMNDVDQVWRRHDRLQQGLEKVGGRTSIFFITTKLAELQVPVGTGR